MELLERDSNKSHTLPCTVNLNAASHQPKKGHKMRQTDPIESTPMSAMTQKRPSARLIAAAALAVAYAALVVMASAAAIRGESMTALSLATVAILACVASCSISRGSSRPKDAPAR